MVYRPVLNAVTLPLIVAVMALLVFRQTHVLPRADARSDSIAVLSAVLSGQALPFIVLVVYAAVLRLGPKGSSQAYKA